ncbi:MAG: substrate-binding domain-containing protein [Phycisphaerales bacterium]|nr:substrate-binding domain-containing protein [Phycisphaerales bacterium]
MIRIALLSLLATFGPALAGGPGEVVLYHAPDEAIARPLIEAFEKKTGVTVRAVGPGTGASIVDPADRVRAEKDAPACDVVWSGGVAQVAALGRDGLLEAHVSESLSDWPEALRDENRLWHAFALRPRVMVFNAGDPPLVSNQEETRPARHMRDFFHPNFRDVFVMSYPHFGATQDHIGLMNATLGPAGIQLWAFQMRKQDLRLVKGDAEVVRVVAQRGARAGLVSAEFVRLARKRGEPVDMIPIRHDRYDFSGQNVTDAFGPVLVPHAVARIKGGPNGQNAALLIDFLLSPEAEEMLARGDGALLPARPEVAAKFPELATEDAAPLDCRTLPAQTEEGLSTFLRAFPR